MSIKMIWTPGAGADETEVAIDTLKKDSLLQAHAFGIEVLSQPEDAVQERMAEFLRKEGVQWAYDVYDWEQNIAYVKN